MQTRIALLGSTGSIGRQTLDVIRSFPQHFSLTALAAGKNAGKLAEQANEFRPPTVLLADPGGAEELQSFLKYNPQILLGEEYLTALAASAEADLAVIAVSGTAGLLPTVEALQNGKRVALANKETLVAAGELVMKLAGSPGQLLPVDSEHSAIWQCLKGETKYLERIILTASGGPFRNLTADQLKTVTAPRALRHPTWSMGPKITIDSATLMNKGLEVIEAHSLFKVPWDKIEVVIHPQSVVHSLIGLVDGSYLAQMGPADMRLPIQYALSWPERLENQLTRLNLAALREMTFEEPRWNDFPCLSLAYEAGRAGGTAPAVLNAANEIAVRAFLEGRLLFTQIAELNREVLEQTEVLPDPDLEAILTADGEARLRAKEILKTWGGRR